MKHFRIVKYGVMNYGIEKRYLWFFWEQYSLNAIESQNDTEEMIYRIANNEKPKVVKEIIINKL